MLEKDTEIELKEKIKAKEKNVQLPMNFITVGTIENDDIKVYIKQDVYKALEKYASADTSKEVGTIILGEYCEELNKTHVIISNYIEAKYTSASASTLTFTHETWDYVHKEHEERYPDKKIIGWQHTHPNYGIFLSNYDMFIQENFFNLPFQVAYVIDPIQNIRGFFQWKNGKVEKLKGFYIYDDIEKPIKIEQTKVKKDKNIEEKTSITSKHLNITTISLSLIAIVMAFTSIFMTNKLKDQNKSIEQPTNEQTQGIIGVQENETDKNIEENENTPKFMLYTIQKGDTLLKICKKNGIDYYSNYKIILSINGIKNPNSINVGQNILLIIPEKH